MVHQERLESGQKWFVCGALAVVGTEALWTIITNGLHFSWIGLLLGVTGFCLMLYLANRLYEGDKQAFNIALGWIAFQLAYAAVTLTLLFSSAGGMETAHSLGAPTAWPIVGKALVYLALGWVLLRMPAVSDFFAEKRGETKAHEQVPVAAASEAPATPIAFTAKQLEGISNLAQYLRWVVVALLILGALQILRGMVSLAGEPTANDKLKFQGLLLLAQGLLFVILALALAGPANEVKPLTQKEDQTTGQLMKAFTSLAKFYKLQIALGLLLVLVHALRFYVLLG